MKKMLITAGLILAFAAKLHAAQSVIIESDGYACMGDDRSRKQTEQIAFQEGKRSAAEQASTYIRSETHVKDAMLEKDLVSAYTNAQIRVLQEMLKEWYRDNGLGECYRVKLKIEVTPDEKAMSALAKRKGEEMLDDPAAPLNVKVWTGKERYRDGENIRVFMKGNRPFYGRVVYKDAGGALVQLLPNPYRKENYFNGGTVYELPSGEDRFDLNVCSPYGIETVTLYASTAPLGELDIVQSGGVYQVRTRSNNVSTGTRGVKIMAQGSGGERPSVAEFAEASRELTTCAK